MTRTPSYPPALADAIRDGRVPRDRIAEWRRRFDEDAIAATAAVASLPTAADRRATSPETMARLGFPVGRPEGEGA
jgi:hypothetical protein